MIEVSYAAIGVAAVAAVVAAFAYYVVFGSRLAQLGSAAADSDRPPAWLMPFELVKHVVLAGVVAGLMSQAQITGWADSALLAVALWVGFPVVLLLSSVVHEKVRPGLAAIHAGDWLIKLVLIAVIIGSWGA